MIIKKQLIGLFSFLAFGIFSLVHADDRAIGHHAYVVRDGKLIDRKYLATEPMECHFEAGANAYNACDWPEAVDQFNIVVCSFSDTPCAHESYFFLGVSYYNLEEYDFANDALSDYLKAQSQPVYFEDAIKYKFAIAEAFRCGAKRRFFSSKRFPKWADGKDIALTIYDEVIAGLPCHEIAAEALFSKGCLLRSMREYCDSIEAYRVLVRRFPKDELAPASYLAISEVYLDQAEFEFQNPDLLALAEITVRRFKEDFPRDERVAEAEANILCIKELYANGLYDMARFYERTGKPDAAIIYYKSAIDRFPETLVVEKCRCRLEVICCEDIVIESKVKCV